MKLIKRIPKKHNPKYCPACRERIEQLELVAVGLLALVTIMFSNI